MRKGLIYITITAFLLILSSCKDFLEIEPLNMVSAENLLATPAGVKTLMGLLLPLQIVFMHNMPKSVRLITFLH